MAKKTVYFQLLTVLLMKLHIFTRESFYKHLTDITHFTQVHDETISLPYFQQKLKSK